MKLKVNPPSKAPKEEVILCYFDGDEVLIPAIWDHNLKVWIAPRSYLHTNSVSGKLERRFHHEAIEDKYLIGWIPMIRPTVIEIKQ